jgi:preprotein translocase subunit SecA
VESAQSRVEGYNFDIRKRVVEFDDVINRQRETIYAERDKVLNNEDLTETIRDFLDDELEVQLDQHLAAEQPDDWDIDGLAKALAGLGLDPAAVTPDELWEIGGREAIHERVGELIDAALAAREEQNGAETWALVERLVLLRTIDALWVEHLTELDDMRRAAGLRGYGGEDPLNAFRKLAFELYEELRSFIRAQVAHTILRVQVQVQPPAQAQPLPGPGQPARDGDGRMSSGGAASAATGAAGGGTATVAGVASATSAGAASAAGSAPPNTTGVGAGVEVRAGGRVLGGPTTAAPATNGGNGRPAADGPAGQKLGRNDPCWCGSGLKYKKCHGR